MATTITITDNADGTGAVATIAGGNAGATNSVYVSSWDGELGATSWMLAGSRTGNGTVNLSLAKGYWWTHCKSDVSGVVELTNLEYFAVTDSVEAVMMRCMRAVKARVQGMTLAGVDNANIVIVKAFSERIIGEGQTYKFPCIQIGPFAGENMNFLEGTNARDDVGYPVMVIVFDKGNQDYSEADLPAVTKWREQIARAFRNQYLVGVPEVFLTACEPQVILAREMFIRQDVIASGLVFRFTSREARGIA